MNSSATVSLLTETLLVRNGLLVGLLVGWLFGWFVNLLVR
jgi:hypothetical protein